MSLAAVVASTVVGLVVVGLAILWKRRFAEPKDGGDMDQTLEQEMRQFVAQASCPALVVGVCKEGRTAVKGIGAVNAAEGLAPDAATLFQIASVSKLFTAALLQVLCDEGVVTLDDTLGGLLGRDRPLSPAAGEVTLRQLATHTSGFPSIPAPLAAKVTALVDADALLRDPYSHLGPEHIFDYLATAPDQKLPGRFEYSNFGMGLLGHVLEVVTGQDYESLLVDRILAPLGMDDTRVQLTPAMRARLAPGHTAKNLPTPPWTFAALAGAGGISASAGDMVRFIAAQARADTPLGASFRKMRMPQANGRTGTGWILPTFIDRLLGNRQIVWHNGMVGGYASYLGVSADGQLGVVVLTNKAVDVTMLGARLLQGVRTQSWRAPTAAPSPGSAG